MLCFKSALSFQYLLFSIFTIYLTPVVLFVIMMYTKNKTSGDGFPLKMGVWFLEVVTNNTKLILIYYASLPLSLSFSSCSLICPPPFVIVGEACWCPPLHPLSLLHIHFMLNWWIKLSLAQNQSWLAIPYSFTLDNNPKERGGERKRDWERENALRHR